MRRTARRSPARIAVPTDSPAINGGSCRPTTAAVAPQAATASSARTASSRQRVVMFGEAEERDDPPSGGDRGGDDLRRKSFAGERGIVGQRQSLRRLRQPQQLGGHGTQAAE